MAGREWEKERVRLKLKNGTGAAVCGAKKGAPEKNNGDLSVCWMQKKLCEGLEDRGRGNQQAALLKLLLLLLLF